MGRHNGPVRRPLRFVFVLLVAVGAAAGWAADDGPSTATTTTTFVGADATGAERQEIVDSYNGHWAPYYRYLNNDGGGADRQPLRRCPARCSAWSGRRPQQ